MNYEQGCNPVNVTYLTGLGWKRQREIVHQYAWNDRRVLPPTGIPLGNVQAGFGYNWRYQKELDLLSFPSDGAQTSPYPFYDRWGDGYNLSQEFVILNQARALGCCAWLMAQTSLKSQPWKSAPAQITGWPAKPPRKPNSPSACPLRVWIYLPLELCGKPRAKSLRSARALLPRPPRPLRNGSKRKRSCPMDGACLA